MGIDGLSTHGGLNTPKIGSRYFDAQSMEFGQFGSNLGALSEVHNSITSGAYYYR